MRRTRGTFGKIISIRSPFSSPPPGGPSEYRIAWSPSAQTRRRAQLIPCPLRVNSTRVQPGTTTSALASTSEGSMPSQLLRFSARCGCSSVARVEPAEHETALFAKQGGPCFARSIWLYACWSSVFVWPFLLTHDFAYHYAPVHWSDSPIRALG